MPDLNSDVRLDGQSIVALAFTPPSSPSIASIERRGYGAAPWVRSADSPLPSDLWISNEAPRLHRDVMILHRYVLEPSLILRRQESGVWTPEQILDTEVVAMDRGVLLGRGPELFGLPSDRTFLDSGTSPNRWVLLPPSALNFSPPYAAPGGRVYDHCRRVLVGAADFTNPIIGENLIPGHYIAEPGADIRIVDSETFVLSAGADLLREYPTTEANGFVGVDRFPATLIDIRIPFRTTEGGTATPGVDYRPVSGIMTLRAGGSLAGNSSTVFAVPILPDRLIEGLEFIEIEFGIPSFGVVEPSKISLPIDGYPQIPAVTMARPPVVFEPLAGQRTSVLPLRLGSAYAHPLVVGYTLSSQTAGAGDFVQGPGTVTVPTGTLEVPIPLTVLADALDEGPESVRLSITSFNGFRFTIPAMNFDLFIDDAPTPGGVADVFTTVQDTPLAASPARNLAANDAPGIGGFSLARPAERGSVTVHPEGTFDYEPDANFIGLDRFAYEGTIPGSQLLNEGASWRWLHPLNGQDPELSVPGFQTNWMKPNFDDSTWAPGTGLMGYGTLGAGAGQAITTPIGLPTGNRYSAYFRTEFTAPNAPGPGFTIQFACDDAAIFYLNGTEIGRYAEAPDPAFLTASDTYTLLSLNFHDADEETLVRTLSIPSAQVLRGRNVLAVSLHNQFTASSDLGLRVTAGGTGFTTHPVLVEMNVTDAGTPPRVLDDAFSAAVTTRPLDSMFFPSGSVYSNDGLLDSAGVLYDPILEVETGGTSAGPVTLDKATGHFRIATPQGFFGSTAFTYRIRDKDGWSNTATVNVTAEPVRSFDIWREAAFGGGAANPASAPEIDGDGDSLANLAEFAFGTNPKAADFAPILSLERRGGVWVAVFQAQEAFGRDCVIRLEACPSLGSGEWTQLALLNDEYESIEELAAGVTKSSESLPSNRLRYTIDLPPSLGSSSFLRLRVTQERHLMDP